MRLSHRDLESILDAVGILNADDDPTSLPARTNDSVKYLVSTDILSFEGFGTDDDYQGPLWYTPAGSVSERLLMVMAELVNEQPFYDDLVGKRISGSAKRISDYGPLSKYKQTAIYNEFFKKVDTDQQIVTTLPVSDELMISVSLCRLGKDFSSRDCAVLNLLTPHLVSAFRNAQFINRLKFESEQLQAALEATRFGIVTIDLDLRIHIQNLTAVTLFRKYFDGSGDSMPDELCRYVRHHMRKFQGDEFYLPAAPFEIIHENSKLKVRITFHSSSGTAVLFLEESSSLLSNASTKALLTSREATVLFWITQGKTDGEIGLLIDISVRTVQKHVEHIFDKLGVETRTAAMAMFLET